MLHADGLYWGEAYPVRGCLPMGKLFADQASLDMVMEQNKRQASLAKSTKKQLAAIGIAKDSDDAMNVLSFLDQKQKTPIIPEGTLEKTPLNIAKKLSDTEVQRLEAVAEQAEQDQAIQPEIPRPKYWGSTLEHYEWCFRLIHEHGQAASLQDQKFMNEFEEAAEFDSYRQRFEDLKLIF